MSAMSLAGDTEPPILIVHHSTGELATTVVIRVISMTLLQSDKSIR